jgi:AraC-like DNA-binding protein
MNCHPKNDAIQGPRANRPRYGAKASRISDALVVNADPSWCMMQRSMATSYKTAPSIDALEDESCAMIGELFVLRTGDVRAAMFSAYPTSDEMRAYLQFLDANLRTPHVSLVDFSRMEGVDQAAFALLLSELEARVPLLGTGIRKQVLVHPQKLAGAFVAGFFAIFVPPYPAEVVGSVELAYDKLGLAQAASAIADARAHFAAEPDWLRSMRRHMQASPGASLDETARLIGLSTRTLQRLLKGIESTYSQELDTVRLRLADERLRSSKVKIASIAAELGFSSGEHFSDWFKRHRGERPSTFRGTPEDEA